MDDKTTGQAADQVWKMMEDIRTCMLVTRQGATLRGRPMHAFPSREEGCVWFLTDRRGHADDELARDPQGALTFAKDSARDFLSVSGECEVLDDRARIDALWNEAARAFWPEGKGDPNIRVLRFLPADAEYWDGTSSSVLITLKMAAARLTGERADLGDNRKVPLD
ncbi:pyridoxamine 5'-phosphate oxidase family protein [Ancylobacter dichloromethanicus]|uniref:General stress protein n=1 Tax=Ancylobacter dichloromethanicus TaxID=518825 RepID=A0A9W6N1K3_9HYPH|nr:pyridoxamine 5'-phosphate oxidase family protein [Ancylobacter dichloromethanicus]MBS7556536.1 pyridoxamine 5'-phosphate oxidase family protein [Ancylobacter dichloromethanicus]GLK74293.1 general stress protein [Ancylobacter dichloromethanicus]